MKKAAILGLLVCAAGLCAPGAAPAGPNWPGVLVAHDASLVYSDGTESYCGLGVQPPSCLDADLTIEGSGNVEVVWKVYAAFWETCSPRLAALSFGIVYPDPIHVTAWGPCLAGGGVEFPQVGWPASGTGTGVAFGHTLTGLLDEVYWFAGYSYYGAPGQFGLGPHPVAGGMFVDDSIPPVEDPILDFGAIGFNEPGESPCSGPPPLGACCTCDGNCVRETYEDCQALHGQWMGAFTDCVTTPCAFPPIGACCVGPVCTIEYAAACEELGGAYQGDCSVCDPNPCLPPTRTEGVSWGRIKVEYR